MLVRLAFLLSFGISAFLAWNSWKGGGVPGCGPDSDCDKVLSSRWGYWIGVPVSVIALQIYAAALVLLFQKVLRWKFVIPIALVVLGAAVWFIGIQAFALRAFCKFCMVAHIAGGVAAVVLLKNSALPAKHFLTSLSVSVALLAALIVGQFKSSPPGPIQFAATTSTSAPPVLSPATNLTPNLNLNPAPGSPPTNQPAGNPTFTFVNGEFTVDLTQVPVSGPLNAPKKMVKLFDYTCHSCRDVHHLLEPLKKKYSSELAIISLPLPLDANCNPAVSRTTAAHLNACEYARLGLAVFFANPEKYEEFSNYIFTPERPPALDQARAQAESLVGKEALARGLSDPRVEEQIRTDVNIYMATRRRSGRGPMPQLLFDRGGSCGAIPSAAALDKILFDSLGLGVPPATNAPSTKE